MSTDVCWDLTCDGLKSRNVNWMSLTPPEWDTNPSQVENIGVK